MAAVMVKRVLMIAYHFPPMSVSSGIQRTLRFAQYLPELDWTPTVLTVHPRAYPATSDSGLADVPPGLDVRRVFALDSAKHLAVRGRYPQMLALPDRWWSWCIAAVPAGLALIRRLKPAVMWTTYPVATAHLIGYLLHRLTGIPWVADFRDPMAQEDYPPTPAEHRSYRWIEESTLRHCRRAVFTAPGALRLYAERYPGISSGALALIENGYDETAFEAAEARPDTQKKDDRPLVLLHSGTIYAEERDPRPFFAALADLQRDGTIAGRRVQVVLRATGCDEHVRKLVHDHGLEAIVDVRCGLPYRNALAEMLQADGLLVLQASSCNYQVPAKVYEYLRARRPVLALTDPAGDTAAVLRNAGIDTIAPLDSRREIAQALRLFLALLEQQRAPIAREAQVESASRRSRTAELARVLQAAAA